MPRYISIAPYYYCAVHNYSSLLLRANTTTGTVITPRRQRQGMTTSATVIDRERTNTKGPRDPRTMWRSSGPESWVNRNWDHWAFSRWYTHQSRRMQSSFVRLDIAQKIAISPVASRNRAYWSQPRYRIAERIVAVYISTVCIHPLSWPVCHSIQ